jgi:hypothetical protein
MLGPTAEDKTDVGTIRNVKMTTQRRATVLCASAGLACSALMLLTHPVSNGLQFVLGLGIGLFITLAIALTIKSARSN